MRMVPEMRKLYIDGLIDTTYMYQYLAPSNMENAAKLQGACYITWMIVQGILSSVNIIIVESSSCGPLSPGSLWCRFQASGASDTRLH